VRSRSTRAAARARRWRGLLLLALVGLAVAGCASPRERSQSAAEGKLREEHYRDPHVLLSGGGHVLVDYVVSATNSSAAYDEVNRAAEIVWLNMPAEVHAISVVGKSPSTTLSNSDNFTESELVSKYGARPTDLNRLPAGLDSRVVTVLAFLAGAAAVALGLLLVRVRRRGRGAHPAPAAAGVPAPPPGAGRPAWSPPATTSWSASRPPSRPEVRRPGATEPGRDHPARGGPPAR
jgi:hypothetical protein